MVHFASCASIRHQIDRDVAHEQELANEGHIDGSWHSGPGYDYVAKWPDLKTLEEIEALPAYRACQRCNPATQTRSKKRAHQVKPTRIRNISRYHLHRMFETPDGEALGVLTSFTISAEHTVLHFSLRDFTGSDEDELIMAPKQKPAT